MSYKCFTFKTTCLLGNIMQAHIALATLRGCELPSSITNILTQRAQKTQIGTSLCPCCRPEGALNSKHYTLNPQPR